MRQSSITHWRQRIMDILGRLVWGMKQTFWRSWWQIRRTVTLRRFQTVVLVGKIGPFYRENFPGGVDQIWGASYAHKFHPHVDRVFLFDHPDHFRSCGAHAKYVEEINKAEVELTGQVIWIGVKKTQRFDLDRLRREFDLPDYYVSSVAYMLAEAIREGFGRIVIHEVLAGFLSSEYIEQKACLDWWTGYALGRGVEVITSEHCMIGKPYWWQSELYGYVTQETSSIGQKIMADAYQDAVKLPRKFKRMPVDDVA